jgi:putative Holliday junction resolvase
VTSQTQGRIIGIDHGDARTGVAASDGLGLTAQPKELIRERDMAKTAARVAEIARELEAAEVVIGLPVNMDGTEGPRAKKARRFGAAVESLLDVPVRFWDERLTSMQAERALRGRGSRQRKAKVDVISAQIMLQSYLDAEKHKNT